MAFDILAADVTHNDAAIRVRLIAQLAQSSVRSNVRFPLRGQAFVRSHIGPEDHTR